MFISQFNLLGEEMREYKKELTERESRIVIEALELALTEKVKANIINKEVYSMLTNQKVDRRDFDDFLLEDKKFLKSKEEIEKEMKSFEDSLSKSIKTYEGKIKNIKITTNPEKQIFLMSYPFLIDKKYFKEKFSSDEEELNDLLKKYGFADKFTSLRLPTIGQLIVDTIQSEDNVREFEDISLLYTFSPVFYTKDNKYGINMRFLLPLKDYAKIKDKKGEIEVLFREISSFISKAEAIFQKELAI